MRAAVLKGSKTPLADYLARPEPVFGWRVAGAYRRARILTARCCG